VSLVVSVHDVAPASAAETLRWCADVDALGIPVSLLVIPGPGRGQQLADTPDFARVLRERRDRGDEVMVHGWTHVAGPQGSRTRRAIGRAVAVARPSSRPSTRRRRPSGWRPVLRSSPSTA
jgi:predicted deacetylase